MCFMSAVLMVFSSPLTLVGTYIVRFRSSDCLHVLIRGTKFSLLF